MHSERVLGNEPMGVMGTVVQGCGKHHQDRDQPGRKAEEGHTEGRVDLRTALVTGRMGHAGRTEGGTAPGTRRLTWFPVRTVPRHRLQ